MPPMNSPSAPHAIATGAKIPSAFGVNTCASPSPRTSTAKPKDPTASGTPTPAWGANAWTGAASALSGVLDMLTSLGLGRVAAAVSALGVVGEFAGDGRAGRLDRRSHRRADLAG